MTVETAREHCKEQKSSHCQLAVLTCYVLLRQQLRVHTICQRNQKTALYAHTHNTQSRCTDKQIKRHQVLTTTQVATNALLFFSNNNKMLVYKTSAA